METTPGGFGILGGGQLARMLAQAATSLGQETVVFAASASEPAVPCAHRRFFGSMEDRLSLERFLRACRTVVFESEFAPVEALREAAQGLNVQFLPHLDAILLLQDKIRQKELCQRLGVRTSPYLVLPEELAVGDQERMAQDRFGAKCVYKWARLGYDGYGTWIASEGQPVSPRGFLEQAKKKAVPVYVEEKVPFKRELAMVGVRSVQGEFAHYPLVISRQRQGMCHTVVGPAVALGVEGRLEREAAETLRRMAESLGLVGAFAIEFFETADAQLWVNEIAPRVHNTGHYTLDSAQTSQFENHVRAVLGGPLGPVQASPVFAMRNLLGPEFEMKRSALPRPGPRSHLHWYGKTEFRPRRKLGHLNACSGNVADLGRLELELEEVEKHWHDEMK